MKPHSFNLVREKWIPCADTSGNIALVSIYEALTEGTQWTEIRCPSPLQTVAVLRVLLAILYRACPVKDEGDWAKYWNGQQFDSKELDAYFAQWEHAFDLFSTTHPFFQVAGFQIRSEIKKKNQVIIETRPISLLKLATELATDSNRLLFERTTVGKMRQLTPAEAVLNLLEIHAFGLGGGISSNATVNGKPVERPNFEDGTIARSASLFFSGANLFETLCLNRTIAKNHERDKPVWEQDNPLSRLEEKAFGPIERLAWLSRLLLFRPEWEDNQTVVRSMFFTQGRRADKDYHRVRDFMQVYTESKKEGLAFVRLNEARSAWRDLHSLLVFDPEKRNLLISHVSNLINEDILPHGIRYRLNVIGIVADKASVTLQRHDRMSLPAALLTDNDMLERLGQGIDGAEFIAEELGRRIAAVIKVFLSPDGKADRDTVSKLLEAIDPRRAYWPRMESYFAEFVSKLDGDEAHAVEALQKWREAAEYEAKRALDESCATLGDSGRAIRATASVYPYFTADRQAVEQKKQSRRKTKTTKG